ncbi:hypothetical protein BGZ49_004763 [Haplosporangium sp. Z 27]|nr:hypothetical protein BGZ49_004763 [Haplosporangium sp. Z 27]
MSLQQVSNIHSYSDDNIGSANNSNNGGINCGERFEPIDQRAPTSLRYIMSSNDIGTTNTGEFSPKIVPWISVIPIVISFITVKALNNRFRKSDTTTKITSITTATCAKRCPFEYLKKQIASKNCSRSGQQDLEGNNTKLPTCKMDIQQQQQQQQQQPERRGRLNPKSIMLASVGVWIFIILSAPKLGLNNPLPYKIVSVATLPDICTSPSQSSSVCNTKPTVTCPQINSGCSSPQSRDSSNDNSNYNDSNSDEISVVNPQDVEDMVRAAEEDLVMDSEWIVTQQDQYEGDGKEKDQLLEAEGVKEDESQENECKEYIFDEEESPTYHVFEYVPFRTEAMVICISLVLGSLISGVSLIRSQVRDMASKLQKQVEYDDDDDGDNDDHKNVLNNSLKVRILANLTSFVAFYWIIKNKYFDIPAFYFAGLGVALVIMISAWIPESIDSYLVSRSAEQTSSVACSSIVIEKDEKLSR